MSIVLMVLPSCLVIVAVLIAVAPLGLKGDAVLVLQIMPYMMAHLFVARGKGFVPSPVMFLAGITLDVTSGGPLGYWALIYLFGVLIARQLPVGLMETRVGRLFGLLLVAVVLAAAQVGLASLYLLDWVGWRPVLTATFIAGAVPFVIDLMWRERGSERVLNVTARGGESRPGHV